MTEFKTNSSLILGSENLKKATLIFEYTHISASSLLLAFDDAKAKRGNPRGILTDQEQDILRAALVMTCAGLDAALKQAIRDCLQQLLIDDQSVREGFEKFIQKRIGGEGDFLELPSGTKFLASILADNDPRARLIEDYIMELTGSSLQSHKEVMRTCAALGLDHRNLNLDITRLKEIFRIRNKIIHELDIDLEATPRKRRVRSQADLLDTCDVILGATKSILQAISSKLVGADVGRLNAAAAAVRRS